MLTYTHALKVRMQLLYELGYKILCAVLRCFV